MLKRVLTTAEAAHYLGLSAFTLKLARSLAGRDRVKWTPPAHVRTSPRGNVGYLIEDLDAWIEAHRDRPGPGRPRKPTAPAAEA